MRDMEHVLALNTPTFLACTKVPASTLNYWVQKGFCTPDIDSGSGRRATRYWSVRDLIVVKSIKMLRDAGCSLQNVAKVEERLSAFAGKELTEAVLFYDGNDVLLLDNKTVMSMLNDVGQGIFVEAMTVITFPLRKWIEEGERLALPVNISEIRARRQALARVRLSA